MKYKSKKLDSHEVYAVFDENNIVIYIGSGANNRHKHCESGCSHVYELNKMHFNGDKVTTKLLHVNLSKESSVEIEKKLILEYRPILNKQFMTSDTRNISMTEGKLLKEQLLLIIRGLDRKNPVLMKFHNQVIDFVDTYKIQGLIKGVKVKYKTMEQLKGKEIASDRRRYFNSIFEYTSGILKLKDDVIERLNAKED